MQPGAVYLSHLPQAGACWLRPQVGEATKSAEEVQQQQQQRLEALERGRLKRMAPQDEGAPQEGEAGDGAAPPGGYAARRLKQRRLEAAATAHDPSGVWCCSQGLCLRASAA